MATYVDLSASNICIYHPAPSNTQQFDFSTYSTYFSNTPELLNIILVPSVSIDPTTDEGRLFVSDEDPNGGSYSFSYDLPLVNLSSSPKIYSSFGVTYNAKPYDFNATTTYNVWLNIWGFNSTVTDFDVCIMGYWY